MPSDMESVSMAGAGRCFDNDVSVPNAMPGNPGKSNLPRSHNLAHRALPNPHAFAGCALGVPCSPLEPYTSMDPKDYVWGNPTPQQQQQLYQQFMQLAFMYCVSQPGSGVCPLPTQAGLAFPGAPFGPAFPHCSNSAAYCNVLPPRPVLLPGAGSVAKPAGVMAPTVATNLSVKKRSQSAAGNPRQQPVLVSPPVVPAIETEAKESAWSTCLVAPPVSSEFQNHDFLDCEFELSADDINKLLEDPEELGTDKGLLSSVSSPSAFPQQALCSATLEAHSPCGSDGSTETMEKVSHSFVGDADDVLLFADIDDLAFSSVSHAEEGYETDVLGLVSSCDDEVGLLQNPKESAGSRQLNEKKRSAEEVEDGVDCKQRRVSPPVDDALETLKGFLTHERHQDWEVNLDLTEPAIELQDSLCKPLDA